MAELGTKLDLKSNMTFLASSLHLSLKRWMLSAKLSSWRKFWMICQQLSHALTLLQHWPIRSIHPRSILQCNIHLIAKVFRVIWLSVKVSRISQLHHFSHKLHFCHLALWFSSNLVMHLSRSLTLKVLKYLSQNYLMLFTN